MHGIAKCSALEWSTWLRWKFLHLSVFFSIRSRSLSLSPPLVSTFYEYRYLVNAMCHTRRRKEAAEVVGGPSSRCKYVGAACASIGGKRSDGARQIKYSSRPGRGGRGRSTMERGNVNSRQHVQPRKNDLGGQCSPRKQAIVVRRRESIASPLLSSPLHLPPSLPLSLSLSLR